MLLSRTIIIFVMVLTYSGDGDNFDYNDDDESSTGSDEGKAVREDADPLAYKLELQRHLADLLPGDLVKTNKTL